MELAIVTALDIITIDAKEHPNLETIKLIEITVFITLAEGVRLQYMKNHRFLDTNMRNLIIDNININNIARFNDWSEY
jgi:hypothetical protein